MCGTLPAIRYICIGLVAVSISPQVANQAVGHLRRDRRLGVVIDEVGPFSLTVDRNHFRMLVRSILSQQLSSAAARTIKERVELLVPNRRITAKSIGQVSVEQLRGAGVSSQKVAFLKGLACAVADGQLRFRHLADKSNDEIVSILTEIRGIGRWTAQMFLIFSLGRLDVFPEDDSGVRAAMRRIYKLPDDADRQEYFRAATRWQPYASVASWYCWRMIDLNLTRRLDAKRQGVS